jgi:hypothetical protein
MSNIEDVNLYRKTHSKKPADLSDTGNILSDARASGIAIGDPLEDSFQRLYSKELDLDEGGLY